MHGQLQKVTVGAHALAVRRAGSGPPLLVLHDGGSTADRDFGTLLAPLSERFSVIAPDLRGHGRSDPVDRVFWPGLVRDLTGLLTRLAVPPAHVLGVGDGATLALHLALEEPERVESLVLAGARVHVPDEDVTRLDALRPDNLRTAAPALADALGAVHGPQWEHLLDRWVASFRLDRSYLDCRSRLHDVTQPTLVLHGVRDALTPVAHADALANGLPHARLVLVDAGRRVQDAPDFPGLAAAFWQSHAFDASRRGKKRDAPARSDAGAGARVAEPDAESAPAREATVKPKSYRQTSLSTL